MNSKEVVSTPISQLQTPTKNQEDSSMPLQEAFDFGLQLKEKIVSKRTIKDYKNKADHFIKWIKEKHPSVKQIHELNKKIVTEFLNAILLKTSARSRNNYRTELSSILQVLEDNKILKENFIKKIAVLRYLKNIKPIPKMSQKIFSSI